MSTVEVCEICDIAECSHIRARRASTGGLSPYVKTYQWAMSGWRGGPIGVACANPAFDGILKQFVKPRQSTLRVSVIRWKLNATNRQVSECEKYLRTLGASGWRHTTRDFGLYECTTVAAWPESKQ